MIFDVFSELAKCTLTSKSKSGQRESFFCNFGVRSFRNSFLRRSSPMSRF